ncbi:MAG: CBS domain-containing protein [Gammaproteobacteria bacterium]|jgi:CBS domain-containing protein
MSARSIMDPHPTVLHPDDPIRTAAQYVMDNRYRRIPVVDDDGRFVGVFGVNCLLRLVLPHAAIMENGLESVNFARETLTDLYRRYCENSDKEIALCMDKEDVETVGPDTPLLEAVLILYRTKASLPVVDPETGKLVGVISYWDLGQKVLAEGGKNDAGN